MVASVSLAGCSGDSNDSGNGGSDDGSGAEGDGGNGGSDAEPTTEEPDMDLFGTAASFEGDKTLIDGSVDSNVLTGFEVVEHVGVFIQANGSAVVSARIENVGSETVRLIDRHTQRAILYGPDGQEVETIGGLGTDTEGQGVDGLPPGETGILNFLGSNGYEEADIDRYGIVLDCKDETTDPSPYCPEA